jgi:hypothetical protein
MKNYAFTIGFYKIHIQSFRYFITEYMFEIQFYFIYNTATLWYWYYKYTFKTQTVNYKNIIFKRDAFRIYKTTISFVLKYFIWLLNIREGSDCSSMEPKFICKFAQYFDRGLECVSVHLYNKIKCYLLSATQLGSDFRLVGQWLGY